MVASAPYMMADDGDLEDPEEEGFALEPALAREPAPEITVEDAHALLGEGAAALVDLRSASQYRALRPVRAPGSMGGERERARGL